MKIASIGGGPAGLYAAILLKRADPTREVRVHERNAPDDTFGFGVVFSEATLRGLRDADEPTYDAIMSACALWDPVEVRFRGTVVRAGGNRFAAIARKRLLLALQERAAELGVELAFRSEIDDVAAVAADADLVLGADGVNSRVRSAYADAFRPRLVSEGGKFIWLGTTKVFDAFTFSFREAGHGRFQAHAYPYDRDRSTFIVECDEASWRGAGLDRGRDAALRPGQSDLDSVAFCADLFAADLDGHDLVANNSKWIDWVTVRNQRWCHENVVLLGDAAHTAHFSIGSGTKLAMEDAVSLARAVDACADLPEALAAYEADRRPAVERVQVAAAESMSWFEHYGRYTWFPPPQFTYSLLTRSRRVTYDNLRSRDPVFATAYERWFAEHAVPGRAGSPLLAQPVPVFTPVDVGARTLANRLVLSAAEWPAAVDGRPGDAELAAVERAARGGAGLVVVPNVAVAADARITPADLGLYTEEHAQRWRKALDGLRGPAGPAVAAQLSHAGRRGATRPRTRGVDLPLREGAWPLVAPSALPYTPVSQVPRALDREGMNRVRDAFARAAGLADEAGFDVLFVHLGQGYLLGSFLSPLTNQRDDGYGGTPDGRAAFPLEVVAAVRAVWPDGKPLGVRLGASDLQRGGIGEDDAVATARRFADAGVDLFDVVAGQTTFRSGAPDYGPAYHAPWSDLVRNRARVPTMTSGNIPTPADANDVIAAGRADLCVVGLPLPPEPAWLSGLRGGPGPWPAPESGRGAERGEGR